MKPSFELASDFSATLETWQGLYQEVVLRLYQTNREVTLSKNMLKSTLARIELLEEKHEQLEQQLSDPEDLIDNRVFSWGEE